MLNGNCSGLHDPEGKGATILQNAGNYLLVNSNFQLQVIYFKFYKLNILIQITLKVRMNCYYNNNISNVTISDSFSYFCYWWMDIATTCLKYGRLFYLQSALNCWKKRYCYISCLFEELSSEMWHLVVWWVYTDFVSSTIVVDL